MSTAVISVDGPAAFLGLVPALAGFVPERSIVAVAFRGTRSVGAIRVDNPASSEKDPAAAARETPHLLVSLLSRLAGVDAVAVVCYVDDAVGSGPPPGASVMRRCQRVLERAGFRIVEALWVGADGWGDYRYPAIPPQPLEASAFRVASEPVPTLSETAQLPTPDPVRAQQLAIRLTDTGTPPSAHRAEGGDRLRRPGVVSAALARGAWRLDDAAEYVRRSVHRAWSEAMIIRLLAWSPTRVTHTDPDSPAVATALNSAHLLGGTADPAPRPDRLIAARELLSELAAITPEHRRAPLLCQVSWLNWACGRGTAAAEFARGARDADPSCATADALARLYRAHPVPSWAFRGPMRG